MAEKRMTWMDLATQLKGPLGGLVAAAFGGGFMSGILFMERFCARRVTALDGRIDDLKYQVTELKNLVARKDEQLIDALKRAATWGELGQAAKLLDQASVFEATDITPKDD